MGLTYAALGYTNFFASVSDYNEAFGDSPRSWAMVPAVRHAMALNPTSKYFFHLNAHALIMNPAQSLKSHLLERSKLESVMLKDVPVVPPDSIIRTFSHLKEKDVDLIVTQDSEDLNPGSFILKNGDFARYFLDLWFDPLFRSYNFAKAETHGLVCLFGVCWRFRDLADCVVFFFFFRIISCNGTQPSSPGLPWSLSAI